MRAMKVALLHATPELCSWLCNPAKREEEQFCRSSLRQSEKQTTATASIISFSCTDGTLSCAKWVWGHSDVLNGGCPRVLGQDLPRLSCLCVEGSSIPVLGIPACSQNSSCSCCSTAEITSSLTAQDEKGTGGFGDKREEDFLKSQHGPSLQSCSEVRAWEWRKSMSTSWRTGSDWERYFKCSLPQRLWAVTQAVLQSLLHFPRLPCCLRSRLG